LKWSDVIIFVEMCVLSLIYIYVAVCRLCAVLFLVIICYFWHVYVLGPTYFVWPWKSSVLHVTFVTSHRGHWPLRIGYHVTRFKVSRNVILHTRYISTCVGAGCGRGRGTKKTNAIRCGACYSIVLTRIVLQVWPIPISMRLKSERMQKTLNNTDFFKNISWFHIVVLFNLSKELVYIPSNTTK
jgi:hypothetical protein